MVDKPCYEAVQGECEGGQLLPCSPMFGYTAGLGRAIHPQL